MGPPGLLPTIYPKALCGTARLQGRKGRPAVFPSGKFAAHRTGMTTGPQRALSRRSHLQCRGVHSRAGGRTCRDLSGHLCPASVLSSEAGAAASPPWRSFTTPMTTQTNPEMTGHPDLCYNYRGWNAGMRQRVPWSVAVLYFGGEKRPTL